MFFDSKILATLEKLGLTYSEAKVYTALVAAGCATATALSVESEVPRTKIYDVLNRLEAGKWISLEKGKPSTYTPRYPKEVVEEKRASFCSELDQLSNQLSAMYDRQIENEALKALLIRRMSSISAKMMEMVDRARRHVIIMGTFFAPEEVDQLTKRIRKAIRNDVTVRIIALSLVGESKMMPGFRPVKANVRLFVPPFEDLQKVDDRFDERPGFVRWVIVDRREMLLAIAGMDEGAPELEGAIAIWLSNASIARYITSILNFDTLWELSAEIE